MSSRTPGSLVAGGGRLPETGDVVGGKYQVEGLLGLGGMGAVYRAQHRLIHRRVALKYLLANDEGMRMRFLREARAMGALDHPNVVKVIDMGEDAGAVYMVMEYMEGVSLKEHLQKQAVPPAEAVRLLMPALQGIAAAHQAGIVHRDLKPANLFVCLDRDGTPIDGQTKVLDFGVASSMRLDGPDSELTQSGAVVGTPRYMAPEQIRGERGVDDRSDQFATGLILYEMLTGRLPYEAGGYEALVVEIATVDPVSPRLFVPELPEELAVVTLKALAKNPQDRFSDIGALARALEPFGEGVVYDAPLRAHARRSILSEDIVELAAASASLTPDPSRSGGLRSTLDAPDRLSGPPTRELGAKPTDPAWFEAPTALPIVPVADPEAATRAALPHAAAPRPDASPAPVEGIPHAGMTSRRGRTLVSLALIAALAVIALVVFLSRAESPTVAAPISTGSAPAESLPVGEAPPLPEPPQVEPKVAPAPTAAPASAESPAEPQAPAAEPPPERRPRRRARRERSQEPRPSMSEMTRAVGRSGSIGVEDF